MLKHSFNDCLKYYKKNINFLKNKELFKYITSITNIIKNLRTTYTHIFNLICAAVFSGLSILLLIIAFMGFTEILKAFNIAEGITTFMSFMVVSLTLSILCYTAAVSSQKNKAHYQKLGRELTISSILLFFGLMLITGFKNYFYPTTNQIFEFIVMLIIFVLVFYSLIQFVISSFNLALVQSGLFEELKDNTKKAINYFWRMRNVKSEKKKIELIVFLLSLYFFGWIIAFILYVFGIIK